MHHLLEVILLLIAAVLIALGAFPLPVKVRLATLGAAVLVFTAMLAVAGAPGFIL